jgi:hypothetical protein
MSIEEICAEAKRFTREERETLLTALIDDLGRSEYDVSDEEVAQRVKETEEGIVECISHDELVSGLKYLPKS